MKSHRRNKKKQKWLRTEMACVTAFVGFSSLHLKKAEPFYWAIAKHNGKAHIHEIDVCLVYADVRFANNRTLIGK